MFNIQIVALGKLKDGYWKESAKEYLKRLTSYAKIDVVEIPEKSFRDSDNVEDIKKQEAKKLLPYLKKADMVIALHERGKEMTSVEFSSFLAEHSERGQKIVFLIGGPLGLHESILEKANHQLSLSQMTLPHQMVRVVFLEQLYRAGTILNGKKYHY